jgi:tellurite resistance protein TehA-like permease
MTFPGTFKTEVKKLPPSAFALVMSTGIVSIAAYLLQFEKVSQLLFLVNKIGFVLLILLLLLRVIFFFTEVSSDLSSHAKGAGFLTIVAGTCLVGMQYVLLSQNFSVAVFLWFFAFLLWLLIMYSFFITVITKQQKPTLEKGLNGSWLLIVVSIQSLSILSSTIQNRLPFPPEITTFLSLSAFLLGFVFYLIIITLVLYRLLFLKLSAEDFSPPYWIDMGACAITTLAAVTFITSNKENHLFNDMLPILKTLAVLSWSVSTWWIPVITILEIWRHVSKQVPIRYNTGYWSMVFPLGMYAVCTTKAANSFGFHFLLPVAQTFSYISLLAWTITFLAMCTNILKQYISPNNSREAG